MFDIEDEMRGNYSSFRSSHREFHFILVYRENQFMLHFIDVNIFKT